MEEGGNTKTLLDAHIIVVSSGISPQNNIFADAEKNGIPVVGELDFVSPFLSGTVIGVTGSNGKTTTTSMIDCFLRESGASVTACGNIGNPAAKAALEKHDFTVMELSSFQLFWAKTFRCDAAVVTNLAPDHIDWHGSYEKYIESKANIISSLKDGGIAIIQQRDEDALKILDKTNKQIITLSWDYAKLGKNALYMNEHDKCASLVTEGKDTVKLFDFADIALLGTHNLENAAMASSVLSLLSRTVTKKALKDFVPPPHRCAYVGEVDGITFVDDSKGTNVAASVTAMSSLLGSKIVIFGGQGKGEDYAPLALAAKKYAKFSVILGTEKEKIAAAFVSSGYNSFETVSTMAEAVGTAYSKASCGDTVLLSPACTSWDMYPNYGARGQDFCVQAMKIIEGKTA